MATTFDRQALLISLRRGEGFRGHVYDDKTGQPIKPGTVVEGHPTIGTGHALDVDVIPTEVDDLWMNIRIDQADQGLERALPYYQAVPDSRRRVLLELAYEMGVSGLLKFQKMLAAVRVSDWQTAGAEMLDSEWAKDVQADRVKRLHDQMVGG